MKKLCLFLAALFFAIIALAGPPRTITHSWNVADTFDKRDAVQWWKGESVTLTYTLTADGVAEDLTGLDLRWNVTERDVATNIYFSVTGTVTAATSGVVEFDLSSSQSRLSSDERYDGYIRVYNVSGGLVRVDVAQAVTANDSPYMGDYEPIGPLPSEEIDPAFTNWLAGAVFLAKDQNLADVADADAAWSNLNGVANGNLNWLRIDDIDVTLPGDLAVASNLVANKIYTVPVGDPPPEPWAAGTIGTAGAHFGRGYIDYFYALRISGLTSLVVNGGVDGPTTRLGPGSVTFYNVTNEVYLGFGLSGNGEYIDTVGLLAADGSMLSNLTVEVTAYTATAPTGAVQAVGFFPVEAYTPTEATTFDFSEFSATKLYRNYEVRINQPGWITEWTYNGATLTPIVNPPASISTNVEVGAYGWWSIRSDYGEPTLMYIDGRTN